MTALEGRSTAAPSPRPSPGVWQPVPEPALAFTCGHVHRLRDGRLDETARRLTHEELTAARLLARAGHDVRSLPESRRSARRPDLLACGVTVEVKSFLPAEERRREPTAQSVFNKLVDASGQGRHAVLVATGSGLSSSAARRGVARYAADPRSPAPLKSLRILGDGFDLAWARRPARELSPKLWSPDVRRGRDTSLGM